MVARVPAAAHHADEARLRVEDLLQVIGQAGIVVVGVDRVGAGLCRGGTGRHVEAEPPGQLDQLGGHRRRAEDDQGRRRRVGLQVDLDRPQLVPLCAQARPA